MGGETQKQQITAEARQAIEAYRESANKNPVQHLSALMQQAVGYMKNKNSYYLERKQNYKDALARHEKDPTNPNALKPLTDPFVVNYEQAEANIRKMIEGTDTKVEDLAKMDEGGFKKLAETILARAVPRAVKELANATWVRTAMPRRQLVSNVINSTTGARHMVFGRVDGEGADSFMTIWPSGTIKVVENGVEKPTILPPFPDIFMTFQNA